MKPFEPKQETVFTENKRNVNYVNSKSKSGEFSPHINSFVADRIRSHCEARNLNKTQFVEQACMEKINRDLAAEVENMTEEEKTERLKQLMGLGG